MSTTDILTRDLAASMKAGDTQKTGTLRLIRGAVKNEEIKLGHPMSEDEMMKLLAREAKQRRDSIDAYHKAGRADLEAVEQAELAVINSYLPEAMSEQELGQVVDGVIAELGATDAKQMGLVIGKVMAKVGARADGGAVAKLVRERLGS